MIEIRE